MEPNKEHIRHFVLFLPKEKCWCLQNYLWKHMVKML